MRLLAILLLAALSASTSAAPPSVRLLSASDGNAVIRVSDGAPEARITELVNALHTAGLTSFTFESKSDRLLNTLKATWFDSGITNITITKPTPPSSPFFPSLDPITARATLTAIDAELAQETTRFTKQREALIDFVSQYGIPETDDTTTLESLTQQQSEVEKQLTTLQHTPLENRIDLAAKIDIPGNPVAKHLDSYQKANQEKARLLTSGFGPKHPDLIATSQEITATHQLAVDELGAIVEALHVQIYQLQKRASHLEFWQQLSPSERTRLTATYQDTKSAYQDSLLRIQAIKATKNAAFHSLKKSQ